MKNKTNIAELLKDCPKGMELDCTICNNVVTLEGVDTVGYYPIRITSKDGFNHVLTHEGCIYKREDAKCVIFPKGKTTWEGFVPPCKFKDGDIVATTNGLFIGIVEVKNNMQVGAYCSIDYTKDFRINNNYVFDRLATTWEKQKLFDAIKSHGYKWNEETKTLEKLIQPKFKVGDVIQDKGGYKVRITNVSIEDECYGYESLTVNGIGGISFNRQDDWELVPEKFDINTLIPFESKVLVRHNKDNKWCGSFFSHIDKDLHSNCYKFVTIAGKSYPMMIPYEGNEHLLGTTDDCDNFYKNW